MNYLLAAFSIGLITGLVYMARQAFNNSTGMRIEYNEKTEEWSLTEKFNN